jgi:hypothetical protein
VLLIAALYHLKEIMADLWGENDEEEADDMLPEGEEEDILDMEGDAGGQPEDALLMRFCPHDSSMLYPQVRPN